MNDKSNEKMTPFTDEYFMKQALVEAHAAAAEGEVPVGAVVVCSDRIIARAHNQTERLNDPTAHAEMLAITAAVGALGAKYLTDCTLYVTVEPCLMCAGAIGWAQISTLVYGASDEKRGYRQHAAAALHPKALVRAGILENECADAMQTFFRNKR
jgi:tRNA(adenine34) deaminase